MSAPATGSCTRTWRASASSSSFWAVAIAVLVRPLCAHRRCTYSSPALSAFQNSSTPWRAWRRHAAHAAIHVELDGRVVVDVPQATTDAAVQAAVQRRALDQRPGGGCSRALRTHCRAHVSGESLFYLGRRYVPKFVVDEGRDGHVRLRGTRIEVAVANGDAARAPRSPRVLAELGPHAAADAARPD